MLLLLFAFLPFFAHASERREFFNSIRSLSMGGTVVAVVNDETALYLNPAGLGRVREIYGTYIDPEIDITKNLPEMHRASSISQPFYISSAVPSAVASPETYYHARAQISPSFVARNFGIGLLGKYVLDAYANSATSVETFYQDDLALMLGYNLRIWEGRIKIGVVGKIISRIELNEPTLNPNTQALDVPTLASAGKLKEGVGVGVDVGVLLTAPWTWLPALGAVVRDVGGTPFDKMYGVRNKDATTRPNALTQDLDAGISISPIHANNIRSTWSLEYKGILTASSENDKSKLYHFGGEFNFGDVFFVRAGYNQRYWTAGIEIASERFQFQLGSYGEEVGDGTTYREDRRYMTKVSFRF